MILSPVKKERFVTLREQFGQLMPCFSHVFTFVSSSIVLDSCLLFRGQPRLMSHTRFSQHINWFTLRAAVYVRYSLRHYISSALYIVHLRSAYVTVYESVWETTQTKTAIPHLKNTFHLPLLCYMFMVFYFNDGISGWRYVRLLKTPILQQKFNQNAPEIRIRNVSGND